MGEFFLGACPLNPSQQLPITLNSLLIRLAWTSAVCLPATWRLSRRPPLRKGILPFSWEPCKIWLVSKVDCKEMLTRDGHKNFLIIVQHNQHLGWDKSRRFIQPQAAGTSEGFAKGQISDRLRMRNSRISLIFRGRRDPQRTVPLRRPPPVMKGRKWRSSFSPGWGPGPQGGKGSR